ncbi:endonuclease domain-containing protein [Sphingomonas sp. ID0503]|uniref:endonuclease domain-containing protein n=1 Tax=Sphingomonas sp. ID0503 TaxID=3399691 RepID=UPI003AFAA36E
MSLPEVLLWERLRGSKTGAKFRRQHPVGPYVADFYCRLAKLVIEVDGEAHDRADRPIHDAHRDAFLKENGYRVLRILASDVLRDVDGVASSIAALVTRPLHHQPAAGGPPPRAGEDCQVPPRHGEGDHAQHGGGGVQPATPAQDFL